LDPALGRDPTLFGSCAILGAAQPGVKAILGPALGRPQGYFGFCTGSTQGYLSLEHLRSKAILGLVRGQDPRLF